MYIYIYIYIYISGGITNDDNAAAPQEAEAGVASASDAAAMSAKEAESLVAAKKKGQLDKSGTRVLALLKSTNTDTPAAKKEGQLDKSGMLEYSIVEYVDMCACACACAGAGACVCVCRGERGARERAGGAAESSAQVLRLLTLLVQKYKY